MSEDKKKLLGEVLLDQNVIDESEAFDALEESDAKRGFLGRILVEKNIISEKDLEEVLVEQKATSKRLGDILVARGLATQKDIMRAFSLQLQYRLEGAEEAAPKVSLHSRLDSIRIPIHVRLSILITLLIIVITGTSGYLLFSSQKDEFLSQTIRLGTALVSNLSHNCSVPLLENDDASLNTLLEELSKMKDISYVMVLDKNGVVQAHSDIRKIDRPYEPIQRPVQISRETQLEIVKFRSGKTDILDFATPVVFSNVPLGTIHAGISLESLQQRTIRFGLMVLVLTLVLVVIGIGVSIYISKHFSRPVIDLVRGATEVKHGNFSYRTERHRNDEMGDLILAFNDMAEGLRKKEVIQDAFGKYVTPEIVDMIIKNPDSTWFQGKNIDVTVMFTDIRGFTAYSEKTEPEEVVAVLNDHFSTATEIIIRHGGHVDKFIGDAMLVVFGVLMEYDNHAERAVRAAVALQEAIRQSHGTQRADRPKLNIGIGINSGNVIAGNIGSQQKLEYTVIGDTVNLASRLTGIAGPGEVIVSRSTHHATAEIVRAEKLDDVFVKGKVEAVEVYRVDGVAG